MHKALANELNDIARKEDKSISNIVRDAVMDYIARYDEHEVAEATKKRLEQQGVYKEVYAEDFLLREENKKISISYKQRTFLNFMDKQLAQVWYMNKDYYSESELEDVLKNHLKSFEVRAEWHGLEGRYKKRREDPIKYAKTFLDRNRSAQGFEVDLT